MNSLVTLRMDLSSRFTGVLCFSAAKIKKLFDARETGDDWSDEDTQSETESELSQTASDTASELSQSEKSSGESFSVCSDSSETSRVCTYVVAFI